MDEVEGGTLGSDGSVIPAGMWVMDEARSCKLVPAALTLWVVRDDGHQLIWVSVETDSAGKVQVNAFDGVYGGAPATVQGSGFVVSLTNPAPGKVRVSGEVPDMGPFEEETEISADGKKMIVNGRVRVGDGETTWYEEFDWRGPSPHFPIPIDKQ